MGALSVQTHFIKTQICSVKRFASSYASSSENPISERSPFFMGQFHSRHLVKFNRARLNKNRAGVVFLPSCVLPLTEENVKKVLDDVRPGLMADGGNVVLHEIDGLVVVLKLKGACGSCSSSSMTWGLKCVSGIRFLKLNQWSRSLIQKQILSEIRPYLSGTGGGELELIQIDDYVEY